jgi:hypothetical protein
MTNSIYIFDFFKIFDFLKIFDFSKNFQFFRIFFSNFQKKFPEKLQKNFFRIFFSNFQKMVGEFSSCQHVLLPKIFQKNSKKIFSNFFFKFSKNGWWIFKLSTCTFTKKFPEKLQKKFFRIFFSNFQKIFNTWFFFL